MKSCSVTAKPIVGSPVESIEPGQLVLTGRDEDGRPAELVQPLAEGLGLRHEVGEDEALAEGDAAQQRQDRVQLEFVLKQPNSSNSLA